MNNTRKKAIKKFMIALLSGVTLMGIGVTAGTAAMNMQQTEVKAETVDTFIQLKVPVNYKDRWIKFPEMHLTPGKPTKVYLPKIAGYTPSCKYIIVTEKKDESDFTWKTPDNLQFVYYLKNKSSVKKTTTKSKGVSVAYKSQRLTKQVKLAPGHDFYNHVPGSKYTVKRVHYGKTYKGKTITVNMQGIRKGMKTPYYRCYYKGKLIGWIYYSAVVNTAKYTTIHKTAKVVANPKNDFYNHLTYSVYKTTRLHYGKTYKNRKVTINKQAVRVGTKTPYYRCYVGGKEIGWIYGGNLTKLN